MNNTDYKCPNCGGNLFFDIESQKVKCEQCGSLFAAEQLPSDVGASLGFQSESDTYIEEEIEVHVFKCDSCGGELSTTEQTAATRCPYCGSPNIIFDRITNDLKPDVMIPFAIDKDEVKKIYWKKIRKHKFVPRNLRKKASVEKLTSSYIPYWLFDGTGVIDADCHSTKVRHSHDASYNYTHTDHYEIKRKIEAAYQNVSWDASREMEDDRMQKLEPYDMSGLKPFENGFLLGYQAERYDVGKEEVQPFMQNKVQKFLMEEVRNSIQGYATTTIRQHSENIQWTGKRYAMFPVWNYHYQYKGKKYEFLINGQTGKFIGSLPKSGLAFLKWFSIIFSVVLLFLAFLTDFKGKDVGEVISSYNVNMFSMDGEDHLMDVQDTYIDRQRTYDEAHLLTTQEEHSLEHRLDMMSEKYLTDFVALTVDDTEGYSTKLYAENFIDYNKFGFTSSFDSVLIMVDAQHRMIWITGTGRGSFYISSERADQIYNEIAYLASDNDYSTMFENGFDKIEYYYESRSFSTKGVSYYTLDQDTRKMLWEEGKAIPMIFFYWMQRVLIALGASFVITGIWWLFDKTSDGVGGVSKDFCVGKKILQENERFIHTTTSRTRRSSSSGSGGGGHHGGSGRSHSGGGGRF